jgi:predicted component of type VI protein secretion system
MHVVYCVQKKIIYIMLFTNAVLSCLASKKKKRKKTESEIRLSETNAHNTNITNKKNHIHAFNL